MTRTRAEKCYRLNGMEIARSVLGKVAADILATAPAEEKVILAWPLAAGLRVAARSKAIQFAEGVLQVAVPDADWRQQLRQFSSQYMASLRAISGEDLREIKFVIRPGSIA